MKVFYELCREVVVHGWSTLSEMPFRGDEGEIKKFMTENKDFHAINIYEFLCDYKLDYYAICLDILAVYLKLHSDSVVGVNLKTCTITINCTIERL